MNSNLLILGAGGYGGVVKETAEAMSVFDKISFLDDNPDCKDSIGLCSEYEKFGGTYNFAFSAFENSELRLMWFERLKESCFTIPILIHPSAFISPSANINSGTIVEPRAVINTNSFIEKVCIIGADAIVDYNTFISCGCNIESGSIIKSDCVIKAHTTVTSGMVVTREDLSSTQAFLEANGFSFEVGV
jgi:UDP-3-O-[3-hydroxymyristoyl] glucosamine N-acyltransferase